jgi:excisionase family DNA binding protein
VSARCTVWSVTATAGDQRSYRIGEVAALVGVSVATLRSWAKSGLLEPARTAGGQRLFGPTDLQRAQRIVQLRRRYGWNPAAIRSALASQNAVEDLAPHRVVGARIRAARRERGWDLADLAERAGMSPSYLSAVERAEEQISPRLLSSVAAALDMPMSAFSPARYASGRVMRAAERPRTEMAEEVVWEELAGLGHALEPALLMVPPGGTSGGPYRRPGEVFVFVLEGSLSVALGDGDVELGPGDSVLVEPFVELAWANRGRARVRAVYVEQHELPAPTLPVQPTE